MPDISIYALLDPDTKEPRYVGQTDKPETRLKAHSSETSNVAKHAWIKSLEQEGKYPRMQILEVVSDTTAGEREFYWIELYRSQGHNLLNGKNTKPRSHQRGHGKKYSMLSVRFTEGTDKLLSELAESNGINRTAMLEILIREAARRERKG